LLDARPAVDPLIEDHDPGEAVYERPEPARLIDDETRLREIFGLLVEAHYRTEPNDLARLLDAPNIAVRALTVGGHVVSVALLERGGGLPEPLRREIYEGARVRGNMIPDVLTSQLRDPDAAVPVGLRVMRIATHSAARSRGFGSELLAAIEAEFDPDGDRRTGRFGPMDYLGVGYGATPELVSFWDENGYATVHLSTTRNDRSGEYSAIMLRPLSPAGEALAARHAEWFLRRVGDALLGPLDDVDPDVVRSVLAAAEGSVDVALSAFEWRAVVGAAYGPGIYDTAPGPFRRLALRALVDGAAADPDSERLLVAKALQARSWEAVTAMLGYVSRRECMLAFGEAYRPLVDRYGTAAAREEADRYR
jgi:tRNA(Met) cytidine acetyltransferase